jgi:3',5'-cyclic AMP phosphodiesterase CpdA
VKYPQPVYFYKSAKINAGIAEIDIKNKLSGKYDLPDWEEKGYSRLGYRIVTSEGKFIYDGKINIRGKGPFQADVTIISGPFINQVTDSSVIISFETNVETIAYVIADGRSFMDKTQQQHFELKIDKLKPLTEYSYTVKYGDYSDTYSFKTAPSPGYRERFTFAFASDTRAGNGGGERSIFGANAYTEKRIVEKTAGHNAAFLQITGDIIIGYLDNQNEQKLQYYNFKNAIEPFAHYFPVNVAMGNHEALNYYFEDEAGNVVMIDKFPFESESSESLFADMFVNPINGPESEDNSKYDPNPKTKDFPTYKESVFYNTYGNIAMVVLNSDYLYAPTEDQVPKSGGNIHGYIMDNQLQWFEKTISELEKDENIDHVFVTIHTPAFPNGGHSDDAMWYNGNNSIRPYISGTRVDKGMIERRDEFLDIMINKSSKTIALLCGDEHNYSRMYIDPETKIYPNDWQGEKLEISRPFWQIINGSAGASYYGQEELIWSNSVQFFSTQYALVFFNINGELIELEVIDPDTGEKVDKAQIR